MEDVVDVHPDHHKMGLPNTPEAEVCPDRQKMGLPIPPKRLPVRKGSEWFERF